MSQTTKQFNEAVLQIVCAKESHGNVMKDSSLVTISIALVKEIFKQLNIPVYETQD